MKDRKEDERTGFRKKNNMERVRGLPNELSEDGYQIMEDIGPLLKETSQSLHFNKLSEIPT